MSNIPDLDDKAQARPAPQRRWLFGLVLCLVAAAGVYFYVVRAQSATEKQGKGRPAYTPVVEAAAATRGDVPVFIGALGTVTPLNTVTVKSRVDGQLVEVRYREGQMVKQGELLARIDPRPFQVQLTQAQGQMARDQALLNNARLDLKRYRELADQDLIPRQQYDSQQALVSQYEGVVKTDQGLIDSARLNLAYCEIAAPIAGRVGLRLVDAGNMVHANDAGGVVVITQLEPIGVIFAIPQDDLPRVMAKFRAGERLPALIFDRDQKRKLGAGQLVTLDNQIDTATGTVKLKAELPNADHGLFPNQFVNVRLLVESISGAVIAPAAAIQRGPRGAFVYVIKEDQTVEMRLVKLGHNSNGTVVIDQGLAPGDKVVVDGAERLRDGIAVEVKSAAGGRGPRPGK